MPAIVLIVVPVSSGGLRTAGRLPLGFRVMSSTLILLRHGESAWNALNLFTGWVDVDLNEKGEREARRGGELIAENGLLPDVLHGRSAPPSWRWTPPTGCGSRRSARGG
jgi:hypothetical protein